MDNQKIYIISNFHLLYFYQKVRMTFLRRQKSFEMFHSWSHVISIMICNGKNITKSSHRDTLVKIALNQNSECWNRILQMDSPSYIIHHLDAL